MVFFGGGDSETSSCIRPEDSLLCAVIPPYVALCNSALYCVVIGLSSLMSSCLLRSCLDLVHLPFGRFVWLGWGW